MVNLFIHGQAILEDLYPMKIIFPTLLLLVHDMFLELTILFYICLRIKFVMAASNVLQEFIILISQTRQNPMRKPFFLKQKLHFLHYSRLEWNYAKHKHPICYRVYLNQVSEELTHFHQMHQILVIDSYWIPKRKSSFHPPHRRGRRNDLIQQWFLAISSHNEMLLKKYQFRWETN